MDEIKVEVVEVQIGQRFSARCFHVIGMMVGTPQLKKTRTVLGWFLALL
jgi:hypothetical protein